LDSNSEKTRSDRYFDERRDERANSSNYVGDVLERLGIGDDPPGWIAFLTEIQEKDRATAWRAAPVFEVIGEKFPRSAWAMIESSDEGIGARFRASLLAGTRIADRAVWNAKLTEVLKDPDLDPGSATAWQASLDWRKPLMKSEWALIDKCLEISDLRLHLYLSSNLARGSDDEWRKRGEYLLGLASEHPEDLRIIDHLFVALSFHRPAELVDSLTSLDFDALDFLLSDDINEDAPWDEPHWVGAFLAIVAKLDEERFLDFVEKSLRSNDAVKRMHVRILGARNAAKAFDKLLESGAKRSHIARFFRWALDDSLLGDFAGSLISGQMKLDDPNVTNELERLYQVGAYENVVQILDYFKIDEYWLQEIDRIVIELDKSHPKLFEPIVKGLSLKYRTGMTTRSPGHPAARDKLILEYFSKRLEDNSLTLRVRNYFSKLAKEAQERISSDIAEDERLAGRRLQSK
jgi:hypothetical protein